MKVFTAQRMYSLYKHTFTKADVFLQEEKINLSTGFLFLCACFNSSESQNMTQNHNRTHRWMVNMQLLLLWGGCCLTCVFSAESWSITVWLYISLSQCTRQGGCCSEQLSLAARKYKSRDLECGFRVCNRAVLSWCMLLQQWGAMAGLCPSTAVLSQHPSPTRHPAGSSDTCRRRHRGQYR